MRGHHACVAHFDDTTCHDLDRATARPVKVHVRGRGIALGPDSACARPWSDPEGARCWAHGGASYFVPAGTIWKMAIMDSQICARLTLDHVVLLLVSAGPLPARPSGPLDVLTVLLLVAGGSHHAAGS